MVLTKEAKTFVPSNFCKLQQQSINIYSEKDILITKKFLISEESGKADYETIEKQT